MDRRNFLRGGVALATGTALASCGGGGGGNDAETSGLTSIDADSQASTTAQTPLTPPAQPKPHTGTRAVDEESPNRWISLESLARTSKT